MVRAKLTPEQFDQVASRLKEQAGLILDGESGTIGKNGVTADYTYKDGWLVIEVTKHPWMVSATYCEKQIVGALAEMGVTVSG